MKKERAPCGGRFCWKLNPEAWIHSKKSGTSCNVRHVSGIHRQEDFLGTIETLLKFLEPRTYDREGLRETPQRVMRAWESWMSGYGKDPADVLKVFEDGADHVDEMVLQRDMPFYSHCEHHLAPFFGTVTIAYIPNGKIVGLSKFGRLIDIYARRLQVQERLTNQIADALQENLHPVGAGVLIRARHMCMESRGIKQQGHFTITSALRGAIKAKPEARAEFLNLASNGVHK